MVVVLRLSHVTCLPPGAKMVGMTIKVRPEEIAAAGSRVREAGNEFGRLAQGLAADVADTGCYGQDELGDALLEMDHAACPQALDYYRATGSAVTETATGMNHLAHAYLRVEQNNVLEVADVFIELGVM